MIQPGYSNVESEEDIAQRRKLAAALMGQASDTSPVGHWTQALARAVQGGMSQWSNQQAKSADAARKKALADALMGAEGFKSLGDADRAILAQNPQLMQSVAGKVYGNRLDPDAGLNRRLKEAQVKKLENPSTDSIQEYEYARRNGFQGSLQDWLVNRRQTAGEYNKVPIFGTDAEGKPVMLQTGSRGDAVATKLPEGVSVNSQKPIEIDGGDRTLLLDPITRQVIREVPKNLAAAETAKIEGKTVGEARSALPQAEADVAATLKLTNEIRNAPKGAIEGNFGVSGKFPNYPGGGAANVWTKIEQLKSRAFLDSFQKLRGGGAITEKEGDKAEIALLRAQSAQSAEEFTKALEDFEYNVKTGLEIMRRKAGVGGPNGNTGWSARRVQ